MLRSVVVYFFFFQCASGVSYYSYRRPKRNPPEWPNLLSIDELAIRGGSFATNYEVITEDGYSLWLHRIGNNTGPPVLVQHGLMVAADQWITRGANRDLAFILLKEGYDVWLPNLRGTPFNEYSLKYPRSDPRFWDFSLHEIGMYDIPAFIDTILDIRRLNQLFYIGHSQGTTEFLIMCSTRPEYNKKIRGAILLSPIAYTPAVEEQTPAVRIVTSKAAFIIRVLRNLGIYVLGTRTEQTINFVRETCVNNENTRVLCLDLIGLASGEDRNNLNLNEWHFFVPYYGTGSGLNVLQHFAQLYTTGEFKAIDLGPTANLAKYGRTKPPHYDLGLVTVPTTLFWGYNDVLTSETSVKRIASELRNTLLVKAVPDPKFGHVDMYISDNAPRILFPDIIRILNCISEYQSPEVIRKKFPRITIAKNEQELHYRKKAFQMDEEKLYSLAERFAQLYSKQNPSSNIRDIFFSYAKKEEYDSYDY